MGSPIGWLAGARRRKCGAARIKERDASRITEVALRAFFSIEGCIESKPEVLAHKRHLLVPAGHAHGAVEYRCEASCWAGMARLLCWPACHLLAQSAMLRRQMQKATNVSWCRRVRRGYER